MPVIWAWITLNIADRPCMCAHLNKKASRATNQPQQSAQLLANEKVNHAEYNPSQPPTKDLTPGALNTYTGYTSVGRHSHY
jgi:hypothetical protein